MRPFLEGGVGNPAALHSHGPGGAGLARRRPRQSGPAGRRRRRRRRSSRPAPPRPTTWPSRASPSARAGRHVVTSAVEHVSVVNACRDLEKQGWSVTWLPVDRDGLRRSRRRRRARSARTPRCVSVMAANGEIGTLQSVRELGRARPRARRAVPRRRGGRGGPAAPQRRGVRDRPAGAVLQRPVRAARRAARSGCAPRWRWRRSSWAAGRRAATARGPRTCPPSSGMGVAADLARNERAGEVARLTPLRDRLLDGLLDRVERRAGHRPPRRRAGCRITPAWSCPASRPTPCCSSSTSAASRPPRARPAISPPASPRTCCGRSAASREEHEGSLCFTLGRWTTAAEIDTVLDVVPGVVARLRRLASPVRALPVRHRRHAGDGAGRRPVGLRPRAAETYGTTGPIEDYDFRGQDGSAHRAGT